MDTARKTPLIIAHRGARDLAPENTIKACQLAIEDGASGLELDIRLCKSGEIVIYHDAFLHNHFGELKRVASVNLDYLKTLEFNKKNYQYHSKINTMEELLEEFKNKVPINLEAKILFQNNKVFAGRIIQLIEKLNMTDQIWISSFNPLFLKVFKSCTQKIKTGLLFRHIYYLYKSIDRLLLSDAWHPHYSLLSDKLIRDAKKLNKEIYLWTIKKGEDIEQLPLEHVDGIISDIFNHRI
jgi:glycerophosphoryl diester phosphodiesterase